MLIRLGVFPKFKIKIAIYSVVILFFEFKLWFPRFEDSVVESQNKLGVYIVL